MATIKDIAKLAGVSHGTVSNVMNHRGNVSSKKIRLVEEAARQLGYNTNAQAQKLRQEYNRHVAFILPDIEQRTHRVFYTSLKAMLEGCQYDTSLYLTNNTPESEHSCIRTALSNRPEYIVTFTCSDTAKEYAGVNAKVIFINHPLLKPRKNQISFFFDFEKAAVAFMEKIRQKKSRTVGFFFDSISVPAHRSFYQSLDKMLGKKKIDTFPFFYDPRQIYHGAIAVLEHIPPVDLVISNNPFYMEKLKQVQELLGCALPDIMTFGMSETMFPPLYPCYEFDYREVARHVFSVIREGKKHFGQAIAVEAKGFVDDLVRGVSHKGKRGPEAKINMLTVASPTADILSTLTPYFRRCTGIALKVVALPYEELFQLFSSGRVPHTDLIRIDMAWASRFEKELYSPLGPLAHKVSSLADSFLPSIKSVYVPDLQNSCTIPFDPSIQMLFYRRDLFEDTTIRRLYYEQTREQLAVPETFAEYNRIAAFFTSAFNPASPTRFGTTMVYGTPTVAACEILSRIKSMGGELFDSSGKLSITTAVFKKALEEYLELKKYSGLEVNNWWQDALKSFSSGLSAMTIIFVNHASRIIRSDDTGLSVKVGTAPVPGNFPLLGGGCIGISKQSRNVEGCIDFFNWVFSDKIANMITLLGGLSPCRTVFKNEEILEIYPWLRNMDDHFKRGWRRISSNLYPDFDNHQFERIFGNAVHNAALGLISSKEALESAQKQCDKEFYPTVI